MAIDYFLGVTDDAGANWSSIKQAGAKPSKLPLKLAFQADSKDEECAGWIQLVSWSFGASNTGSFGIGGGGGSGKVAMQDFHFTMHPSTATPELFKRCCGGDHFKHAFIIAKKSGGAKPVHHLRFWFSDLLISSYNTSGAGGGDEQTDSISFNFATMQMSFTAQKADGSPEPSVDMGWDLVRNVPKQ